MNDFLTTILVEDHRRELLAEARAEALAHEALAGRKPWWHRLVRRTTDARTKPAATSLNGHMAASIISAPITPDNMGEPAMTTMLFRSESIPTGLGDEGPDNLHAAEAAATVHGDSVNAYGIELGEATDDDVEATIISAATIARATHH